MNSWPELKSRVIHRSFGTGTVTERYHEDVVIVHFDIPPNPGGKYIHLSCNIRTLEYIMQIEELALISEKE